MEDRVEPLYTQHWLYVVADVALSVWTVFFSVLEFFASE